MILVLEKEIAMKKHSLPPLNLKAATHWMVVRGCVSWLRLTMTNGGKQHESKCEKI